MLSEQRDDLGEDWFAHKLPFVVLRNNTGSDFKFLSHLRIENVKSSSLVITTALSQITPGALDPSIKVASLRFINVWTTCMYLKTQLMFLMSVVWLSFTQFYTYLTFWK